MMGEIKTDYTREELLDICAKAIVPHEHWHDRDSASSQMKVGSLMALLSAGCEFKILTKENDADLQTDKKTIWVEVAYRGFQSFEWGVGYGKREDGYETDHFYIPTPERLSQREGKDWY